MRRKQIVDWQEAPIEFRQQKAERYRRAVVREQRELDEMVAMNAPIEARRRVAGRIRLAAEAHAYLSVGLPRRRRVRG